MSTWTPSDFTTTYTGTNGRVTAAVSYASASDYVQAGALCGFHDVNTSGDYDVYCTRLTIVTTVRTKKVTIKLKHDMSPTFQGTDSYNTSKVKYYAKLTTTASWPAYNSTGTTVTLTSSGENEISVELAEPVDPGTLYLYLWAYRVGSRAGYYGVCLKSITGLTVVKAVPNLEGYDGTAWKPAKKIEVYNGTAWVELKKLEGYDGSAWREA